MDGNVFDEVYLDLICDFKKWHRMWIRQGGKNIKIEFIYKLWEDFDPKNEEYMSKRGKSLAKN